MKITQGNHINGAMLELFSISPKLKGGVVFIIDMHLDNIISSSYKGLKCIQLNRCAYIKSIQSISKCLQLQKLVISYNQNITTQSLTPIIKRCLKLQYLQLSQCKNIDQTIFNQIKKITQLKKFILKSFRQSFGHLHYLLYCQKLEELNIDDSLINDEQFMNGIRQLKKLKVLSMQGCALLTNLAAEFLIELVKKQTCNLKIIHVSRIANMSLEKIEEIQETIFQKILIQSNEKE